MMGKGGNSPPWNFIDRRYHGIDSSGYPLPNDTEEIIRLDKLHYVFRCILRRNIVAPINPNPTAILDVGTGSGRWVVEVADQFPEARVIGMDLSPANPLYELSENCEFIVGDATEGLKFDDNSLDLVHSRCVSLMFTNVNIESSTLESRETSGLYI
jgi:ubiquinone/menaquinone biosynthesis C-methylase UbiE